MSKKNKSVRQNKTPARASASTGTKTSASQASSSCRTAGKSGKTTGSTGNTGNTGNAGNTGTGTCGDSHAVPNKRIRKPLTEAQRRRKNKLARMRREALRSGSGSDSGTGTGTGNGNGNGPIRAGKSLLRTAASGRLTGCAGCRQHAGTVGDGTVRTGVLIEIDALVEALYALVQRLLGEDRPDQADQAERPSRRTADRVFRDTVLDALVDIDDAFGVFVDACDAAPPLPQTLPQTPPQTPPQTQTPPVRDELSRRLDAVAGISRDRGSRRGSCPSYRMVDFTLGVS